MASAASTNIVNSYYQAILRFTPSASLANVYASQLDSGTLTSTQLESQLISSAQSSTIPALLTYDLLYNTTPTTSGVTYLTNYASALQSGNYTFNSAGQIQIGTTVGQFSSEQFSLLNTYVNLGATFAGDPNSAFAATYGSLDRATYVNQIYTQIFGKAPAQDTQQFLLKNFDYYANYAGSEIGGRGAIAGLLLDVAEQSKAGPYPAAAASFLSAAATSTAAGADTAAYGKELIATYGNTNSQSTALTTGIDNIVANLIAADLTPYLYNGVGPTLNVGDRIAGTSGQTNNTFTIGDQYGTGTDVIPAGVVISNVQTIDLTTQGNAGGASPASQGGGGASSGVFNLTTSASDPGSTISGVKAVNVISSGALLDNVRVDPGAVNSVDVTVNHQHVAGIGGVQILGGHNITVSDGDGTLAGLVADTLAPPPPPPFGFGNINAGVTIGSPSVVNTNSLDLNPTGAVAVNEIGNNQIIVNGGATVTVSDAGGGGIQVGQPTGGALGYPSDEPVGAVTINDNANTQAGTIRVYSSAPVTNSGTTTNNATTATINETALLAGAINVGAISAVGGINQSFSPAGNVNVTVAAGTPVNYDFTGQAQSGITPAVGLTTITVVGGATVNVATNANSVVVGSPALNGVTPVANGNASGDVTVVDSAVVGLGVGGAAVTVVGGQNVNITNAGGAVQIGAVNAGKHLTIAPSGTETVTNTAPLAYDNVFNTGSLRDVNAVGGTTVKITTNAGGVTVGTLDGVPGSEPTGTVTVVDTASPGQNVFGAGANDASINVYGGTDVTANSANGAITIGSGTASVSGNPSGNVTATTNGIETGGQFHSTTTVNGGANVTVATTGAGGNVSAGSFDPNANTGASVTGAVSINDTFSGSQNADSFQVVGGTTVAITTTATSGAISVGDAYQGAPTPLDATGAALKNGSVFASGDVNIVNGVAGNWGTGPTTVNTNGSKTVTVAGGGLATITDEQTTPATGGAGAGSAIGTSTLATVSLDGAAGATITSDALTSLTVLDDKGNAYAVNETPAHSLALGIGGDAGFGKTTTVDDATATSVTVTDNGKATAGTLDLVVAKATSATFTTTTALNVDLTSDAALTSIALANGAALNLGDLSGASVKVTAGAKSTGAVTITGLDGSTSGFDGSGSTGNDSITLTSNTVAQPIRAGSGTTNTVTANYAAGAGDKALSSETTGFNALGVGAAGRSDAVQDTITVDAIGAVGSKYFLEITVAGGAAVKASYTQVAGDTAASVAAGLLAAAAAALAGTSAVAGAGTKTNQLTITAQAGLSLNTNVPPPTSPGNLAKLTSAAGQATNAYNATGFGTLSVDALAGPVTFSNVGASETLNITGSPGHTVTLAPTAASNSLTIVEGVDGPATGAGAGTPGVTATVTTAKTATLNVVSQGVGGTTSNVLTVSDNAVSKILISGDESQTLIAPATDAAFSSVSTIDATGTQISTQPSSKNVTNVTGVVVAASGVTVTGGDSTIIAAGVNGTDFQLQQDTIVLTGPFAVGDVLTATFNPTVGVGLPLPSITISYTVQASDLGGTALQIQQNIAAQLAALINSNSGNNLVASTPTTDANGNPLANGELVITGTTSIQQFTDTGISAGAAAPTSAEIASPLAYTQAQDNFITGSGGGTITLGVGGGYNPFAAVPVVTAAGPPPVTTTFYGAYDAKGFEKVDLTASAAKTDTIKVGASSISATFAGGSGGITAFQEGATAAADTLNYADGYTVLQNNKAGTKVTDAAAKNIADALDPTGALAKALPNLTYSSTNGVLNITGTSSTDMTLQAAEIIVSLAAENPAGPSAIAAVSDGTNTYVIAAEAGNNLAGFSPVTAPPYNSQATGVSIVELNGTTVTGFGSSVTPGGVVSSGIGAQGAVLANVLNTSAGNTGVTGQSKTYDDTGFSRDTLTASQDGNPSVVTTYSNLAPASQLDIAAGGHNVGSVVVAQTGTASANSLIVDLQSAGDTVQSLKVNGDWKVRLVADASGTVKSLTDGTSSVSALEVFGSQSLNIGTISATALTTIDASKDTGSLTLGNLGKGGVKVDNLVIKGALGGDSIVANGASNTIDVGSAANSITGVVNILATGNADTITLVNEGVGSNLNLAGANDVISVDTGINNIFGGVPGAQLQSKVVLNFADGGTDNTWVGANATVNLTGNKVTETKVFGESDSSAVIEVKGDTAGTTSAGFASGGTGALTTITGADPLGGNGNLGTLKLEFLNAATENFAGGTADRAFVNVQGAASLSAALDTAVNQSLVLDTQILSQANTEIIAGVLDLRPNTGVLSWFQYGGNTYLVEATNNNTTTPAAHAGLQASDTVVKFTGLVDLSHAAFGGNTLTLGGLNP